MAAFAGGLPVPPELMGGQGFTLGGGIEPPRTSPFGTETPGEGGVNPTTAAQGDTEQTLNALSEIMRHARSIQEVIARVLPGSAGLIGLIAQAAEALHRDISQAQQARARRSTEDVTAQGARRRTPTETTPRPPVP